MMQIAFCLLTLLFSMGSPAMEENADFRQSTLAAKTTVLGENMTQRVMPFAERTGARTLGFGLQQMNGQQ